MHSCPAHFDLGTDLALRLKVLTGKPHHLETFDYLGPHRYFLTFCTYQRHRAFEIPNRVVLVRTQFGRAAEEQHFALLAYCFMPDHVHLLVEGLAEDADGLRFVKAAKQYSGFYYQRSFAMRLWQRYSFERVLRGVESAEAVAKYIFENPIRAGLVTRVEDYPFLGSDVYETAAILEAIQLRSGWHARND